MIATTRLKNGMVVPVMNEYTGAGANVAQKDGIGLWRQQRTGCRRRQRDIWIHYEVGDSLPCGSSDLTVQLTKFFPAMTASQMRIAETIDAFYGDAGTRDGVSRSYKQAVEDLDAETIKALDGPYR
jgi:hypothetical protein